MVYLKISLFDPSSFKSTCSVINWIFHLLLKYYKNVCSDLYFNTFSKIDLLIYNIELLFRKLKYAENLKILLYSQPYFYTWCIANIKISHNLGKIFLLPNHAMHVICHWKKRWQKSESLLAFKQNIFWNIGCENSL